MDNNPAHFGKEKQPHPAYITVRYGHRYRANSITHSRSTTDGKTNYDIIENPNKKSKDKRHTRISSPFWQKDTMFSKDVLQDFRFSNESRKKIKKFNKKYK